MKTLFWSQAVFFEHTHLYPPPPPLDICPVFPRFSYFPLSCHSSQCNLEELETTVNYIFVCMWVWPHVYVVAIKTALWREARRMGTEANAMPINNNFPQVDVCMPGMVCCHEEQSGSLPDQIPLKVPYLSCLPKCSAYQWVLLTCQSRQQIASSAL